MLSASILLPENAPSAFLKRAVLWNAAEQSERRKNSCVARELILALPHELDLHQQQALVDDMSAWLVSRYAVAVDRAIHAAVNKEGHDQRNTHAHLLFTTRAIDEEGMAAKTRILDDKKTGREQTELIRQVWETLANDALARAGFEDVKIDRRTLEEQGIDRVPQTHIGPNGWRSDSSETDDDSSGSASEDDGSKSSSSSSSSGGGSQAAQAKSQKRTESEEGEADDETGKGEQGGGDAASIKLESKPRKDHKGRVIEYPRIDQLKSRKDFVAEIKRINERREAFGETPLREQIRELDDLSEKLDARLERLQGLEDKVSITAQVAKLIKGAVEKAAEIVLGRDEARAEVQSRAEEKEAKRERHQRRYGREYRSGLHERISEMKSNMKILEAKKQSVERYAAFVDKIEAEIVRHEPAVKKQLQPDKPAKRSSVQEVSLKLKLKASIAREDIPAEFKPPKTDQPSIAAKSDAAPEIMAQKIEEPVSLKDKSVVFNVPSYEPDSRPQFKDQMRTAIKDEAELKQEEWKTKNAVPIKAISRAIETHAAPPSKQQTRIRTGPTLNQELRREHNARVEKAREHVPEKHKPASREVDVPQKGKVHFKDLEEVRSRKREDEKGTSLRSKFKTSKDVPVEDPPIISNEEHCELREERAQEAQNAVPPQHKPKTGGLSAKMTSAFNTESVDGQGFDDHIDDPEPDIGPD